jgi:hypothetical protein
MHATSLAILLTLASVPALAATNEPVRYRITPVSGGFVRLDTASGAMTFCRDEVDKFRCEPLPVEADKAAAASARGETSKNDATRNSDTSLQDFDKALSLMERAMKSFMSMTREDTRQCAL